MSELLLIGPCLNKNDASQVGGIVVLFDNYMTWLNDNGIVYSLINTNKKSYSNIITSYISICCQILTKSLSSKKIFFHGTANDFLYIAPLVVIISKLFAKKVILRKFAGNFNSIYSNSSSIKKKVFRYTLQRADVLFFETNYLVKFGLDFNRNTYWFPNVRKVVNSHLILNSNVKKFKKRLVFISQIKPSKGIDEILIVSNKLSSEYVIDIYGPILDKKYSEEYFSYYKANYLGILSQNEVINTLNEYDILLLPSFREGYPGVIIEAFSLGIPVIVSDVGGLPEMVKSGKEGFVIKPKDAEQLIKAILSFDEMNYNIMSKNALKKFNENYNSEIINPKIFKLVSDL
ncbi:hypothetical protein FACS189426_20940 [Bacteroidia bacterium]|nr:hypothetical protein FACS189426_20940 [Bacteroidia bacterium]GHV70281.1 hypothetical protein FACS189420_0720 [Bacteroidia bacterium]